MKGLMMGRNALPFLVAASALLAVACNDTVTTTEVPAFVSPTPAPTPIPQPASMSGVVSFWGGAPNVGATVECQGKSTITVNKGAYDLAGLSSGTTTVTVRYQEQGTDGTQDFTILLKPGPNQVDLGTGPG